MIFSVFQLRILIFVGWRSPEIMFALSIRLRDSELVCDPNHSDFNHFESVRAKLQQD